MDEKQGGRFCQELSHDPGTTISSVCGDDGGAEARALLPVRLAPFPVGGAADEAEGAHLSKFTAWYLLMQLSFILVYALRRLEEKFRVPRPLRRALKCSSRSR